MLWRSSSSRKTSRIVKLTNKKSPQTGHCSTRSRKPKDQLEARVLGATKDRVKFLRPAFNNLALLSIEANKYTGKHLLTFWNITKKEGKLRNKTQFLLESANLSRIGLEGDTPQPEKIESISQLLVAGKDENLVILLSNQSRLLTLLNFSKRRRKLLSKFSVKPPKEITSNTEYGSTRLDLKADPGSRYLFLFSAPRTIAIMEIQNNTFLGLKSLHRISMATLPPRRARRSISCQFYAHYLDEQLGLSLYLVRVDARLLVFAYNATKERLVEVRSPPCGEDRVFEEAVFYRRGGSTFFYGGEESELNRLVIF